MQKQDPAIAACSVAPPNQESKKPPMASQKAGAAPPPQRSFAAQHEIVLTDDSPAPEDFEFCVLSSGGLAGLAGGDDAAAGMCAADEVFSGGKLLPLRLSSAAFPDAFGSGLLLLRSDSLDGGAASSTSSRSTSRSASSSSSSSSVSRSTSSSSSASSSDPAASLGSSSHKSAASASVDAVDAPRRRSTSGSVFYAHPSPSPRPPRRSSSVARRSTGTAPPAAWGIFRLGVVGAPEVYPRRAPADSRKVVAATAVRGGGSQSARFVEQATGAGATREVNAVDNKKLGLGLFGAGLVCSCSPDAVAPVGTVEAAAAEARRRRKKAEDKKKRAAKQSTSRQSRILDWLEEHSPKPRTKNVV